MGAGGSGRCNDQVTLEVKPEAGEARALPIPEEAAVRGPRGRTACCWRATSSCEASAAGMEGARRPEGGL